MLTKAQKLKQIEESKKMINESQTMVFVDFSGVKNSDLKELRRQLMGVKAKMKVFKKRLLRVAFKDIGVDFTPEQFESQAASVFSPSDISSVAGIIYKFYKKTADKGFKILGGFDLSVKSFIAPESVAKIGQLPSREVLLGQLVGMISAPLKMFMNVLEQKSKQTVDKV